MTTYTKRNPLIRVGFSRPINKFSTGDPIDTSGGEEAGGDVDVNAGTGEGGSSNSDDLSSLLQSLAQGTRTSGTVTPVSRTNNQIFNDVSDSIAISTNILGSIAAKTNGINKNPLVRGSRYDYGGRLLNKYAFGNYMKAGADTMQLVGNAVNNAQLAVTDDELSSFKNSMRNSGQVVSDYDTLEQNMSNYSDERHRNWRELYGRSDFQDVVNGISAGNTGATAGMSVGGPWGAVIGGVVGLGSSIGGSIAGRKKAKREANSLNDLIDRQNARQHESFATSASEIAENQAQDLLRSWYSYGGLLDYANGEKIHINPKNKGKFTEAAKKAGMGVQEYARHILANKDKYSSTLVKRANFARNAKHFNHRDDGGPNDEPVEYRFQKDYINGEGIPEFYKKGDEKLSEETKRRRKWIQNEYLYLKNYILPKYANLPDASREDAMARFMALHASAESTLGDFVDAQKNNNYLGINIGGTSTLRKIKDEEASWKYYINLLDKNYQGWRDAYTFDEFRSALSPEEKGRLKYNSVNPNYLKGLKTATSYLNQLDLNQLNEPYYDYLETVAENKAIVNNTDPDVEMLHILNDPTYNYKKYYNNTPKDQLAYMVSPYITGNFEEHWPDTYKTGYHPTFSDESIYSGEKSQYNPNGLFGGHWIGEIYIPNEWDQFLSSKGHSYGGELNTNGANFSNGLLEINEGLTHELNPLEGVPMGFDREGTPNVVEEGETIYDIPETGPYVFSTRGDSMPVPKEIREKYHLGNKKNLSFAEASKKLAKESEERPNDPISKAAMDYFMEDLKKAQDQVRARKQQKEQQQLLGLMEAAGITPQELAMAQQQQDQMASISPEEQAMMQQQYINPQETNMSAYGGRVNKYTDAGDIWIWDYAQKKYVKKEDNDIYDYANDPNYIVNIVKDNDGNIKRYEYKYNQDSIPIENLWRINGQDLPEGIQYGYTDDQLNTYNIDRSLLQKDDTDYTYDYYKDDEGNWHARKIGTYNLKEKLNPDYEDDSLRYAPAIGSGIQTLLDSLGLTNTPNYENANTLAALANSITPQYVEAPSIGDYMTYKPYDVNFTANVQRAADMANRRALLNNAGLSRGLASAALLAQRQKENQELGDLYRAAYEYNLAQREKAAEFNRNTNIQNAAYSQQAQSTNASNYLQAMSQKASLMDRAMSMRDTAYQNADTAKASNFSNFFDNLGIIGENNYNNNIAKWMAANNVYGTTPTDSPYYSSSTRKTKKVTG